jgi:GAF domain-containing protein
VARCGQVAEARGVCSSLSLPLTQNEQLRGGVNLYAAEPLAFDANDVCLGTAFASQATTLVLNAHAFWAAVNVSRNLAVARESPAVVVQP